MEPEVSLAERPDRKRNWQTVTSNAVLALLAIVFLFSAISKLVELDAFRWALIDAGISNNTLASIGANILVSLELALGLLLLLRLRFRKLAYPASMALLVLFSLYLASMLIRQGNAGDCGCFGDWLPMRPLPALLKNIAMMLGLVAVRRLELHEWRAPVFLPVLIISVSFLAPGLAPKAPGGNGEKLSLKAIYAEAPGKLLPDLKHGRHVVAFMSLGCPHCREAAHIFSGFLKADSMLPVLMVLNGTEEASDDFFRKTGARNVPHTYVPDPEAFISMAGKFVPSIYYLEDSRIERRVSYRRMTLPAIRSWAGR